MQIMDCTMRDGGNVIGSGFPRDLTFMMLRGLTENGISVIEYGNAKGIGAEELGFAAPCTDKEYLEIAQPFLDKAEIGMFLNAKRYKKENVELVGKAGLHFLRVGADAGDGHLYYDVIQGSLAIFAPKSAGRSYCPLHPFRQEIFCRGSKCGSISQLKRFPFLRFTGRGREAFLFKDIRSFGIRFMTHLAGGHPR